MSRARVRRRYVQWMRWQHRIDTLTGTWTWGARGYQHRVVRAFRKLGAARTSWSVSGRIR